MKSVFTFLVIAFLASCTSSFDKTNIIGSWKMKSVIDSTDQHITNKISFFANDSMSGEIYTDGKLQHQFTAKYDIDEATKTLNTYPGKGASFHFEILKLTTSDLELQKIGTKRHDKYVRY